MSHDKYGRRAHIGKKNTCINLLLRTDFNEFWNVLVPKDYDVFINHDAVITLTFLQGQHRSPMHLNGEIVKMPFEGQNLQEMDLRFGKHLDLNSRSAPTPGQFTCTAPF